MATHQTVTEVFGMPESELAQKLGDLRYDSLELMLNLLAEKISGDALKDLNRGRKLLADALASTGKNLLDAAEHTGRAWKISKPHMKKASS